MATTAGYSQKAAVVESDSWVKPIDIGFRWYDKLCCLGFSMLTLFSRIDGASHVNPIFSPSTDRLLDITIELADGRPDTEMQLKVTADIKEKK